MTARAVGTTTLQQARSVGFSLQHRTLPSHIVGHNLIKQIHLPRPDTKIDFGFDRSRKKKTAPPTIASDAPHLG